MKRESIAQQIVQLLAKCYSNLTTSAPVISRLCGCDASNHESHPLEQLVELVDNVQLKEIWNLLVETQPSDISLEKGSNRIYQLFSIYTKLLVEIVSFPANCFHYHCQQKFLLCDI